MVQWNEAWGIGIGLLVSIQISDQNITTATVAIAAVQPARLVGTVNTILYETLERW